MLGGLNPNQGHLVEPSFRLKGPTRVSREVLDALSWSDNGSRDIIQADRVGPDDTSYFAVVIIYLSSGTILQNSVDYSMIYIKFKT